MRHAGPLLVGALVLLSACAGPMSAANTGIPSIDVPICPYEFAPTCHYEVAGTFDTNADGHV
ncbi:MAG: hypothetical protein ACOY71_05680 [Gemmatimonadota bacterium]